MTSTTARPAAVVLYGPPGSGKDTVTKALRERSSTYVQYRRLKVSATDAEHPSDLGRLSTGTTYRTATPRDLDTLDQAGALLYVNHRYGNTYAVDIPELHALTSAGRVPVMHLGQVEGITAVTAWPARWIRVLLWCPRDVTAHRVTARGSTDLRARLAAWDDTRNDLAAHPDQEFDVIARTDHLTPEQTADLIHSAVCAAGVHLAPNSTPVRDLAEVLA